MESGTFGRTGWSSRCLTEGSPLQWFFRCLLRSPAVLNIAWHLLQLVVVGGDGVGFDVVKLFCIGSVVTVQVFLGWVLFAGELDFNDLVVDRHIIVGFEVFGLEVFRLVFFWHGVPGIVAFVPGISGLFVVEIFEIGLGVEGLVVGLFVVVHLVVFGLVVLFWFVALGFLVVLVSIDWLPVIKLVVAGFFVVGLFVVRFAVSELIVLGVVVAGITVVRLNAVGLVVVVFVSELLDIVDALSSGSCIELERLK